VDLELGLAEVAKIEGEGGEALAVKVDVRSPAEAGEMVAAAVSRWGRVDVLVNNAGITGLTAPLAEYPEEEFRRILEVDLMGVFHCLKAALPPMLERGYGRVVNIASVAAKEGSPGMPAYSAAKAAVVGLTRSAGKELARSGILVNCVLPGAIGGTGIGAGVDLSNPLVAQRMASQSSFPINRLGEPREVAELVAFLASPRCTFSAGAAFDVSGGRLQP